MRQFAVCALILVALALAGCPNPNAIGVQVFGSVNVHAVQASNGQPVAGALVNAGSTNTCPSPTDASGNCTLTQVPVGTEIITANAPGLAGTATVNVTQDQTVNVTVQMNPSNG